MKTGISKPRLLQYLMSCDCRADYWEQAPWEWTMYPFWITVPNGRWKRQLLLRNKNFEEFGVWVKLMLNSLKFKGGKLFTLTIVYVQNLSNISITTLLPKGENTIESCLMILDLAGFGMIILKSGSYYKISCKSFGARPPCAHSPGCRAEEGLRRVGIYNH